ncbi:hypothetical protein A3Q56_07262 [Intoshia linei]|uniref:Transposase Tc1-like domain-containing protein n=1 Tax=Intoshia linei TaxID=1819745 RepID=A0A177AT80_9BILA|nr:hypothetical protein A3Q56_07262 [Intoshia linei]
MSNVYTSNLPRSNDCKSSNILKKYWKYIVNCCYCQKRKKKKLSNIETLIEADLREIRLMSIANSQRDKKMVGENKQRAPLLSPLNKKNRLKWAKETLLKLTTKKLNLEQVTFSDEKIFLLDGPDGCRKYWAKHNEI